MVRIDWDCMISHAAMLFFNFKKSYIIEFSLSVGMLVRSKLPNHVYYGDEAFTGDSVGLGLGQRLNFISKKLILRYFWGKMAPDEKILFETVQV